MPRIYSPSHWTGGQSLFRHLTYSFLARDFPQAEEEVEPDEEEGAAVHLQEEGVEEVDHELWVDCPNCRIGTKKEKRKKKQSLADALNIVLQSATLVENSIAASGLHSTWELNLGDFD